MLPRSAASLTANLFILEFHFIKLIEPKWSQFISELKIVKCGEHQTEQSAGRVEGIGNIYHIASSSFNIQKMHKRGKFWSNTRLGRNRRLPILS